ncbi:MAG TPA: glycoside hydrolase family 3 C-terminal domain-containing protein [Trebonia sp.]|nr:glycoside hydrolase family 3 C-terminal domain-containing protein [Trebonia sp.]
MIGSPTIEAIRYRDPAFSFGERADDLLGRLTADEKIAMLHQRSPAVPRLGLAVFHTGMEGVHGASWRDHAGTGKVLPATVFPQPVGLAAAWDPDLAHQVGRATGREIRALHDAHPLIGLNVWAPVVNLLRDPRWGRNEEGYSEDPLLGALLGTAFSAGLSGGRDDGYLLTAPTLKHFLGYNNEDFRDLTSSGLRPRVLHEYDLVPFRAAIEAGAATGVMPSYNLVNGRPAHVSPLLRLIRDWTSEELLTCSDAWAPSNLVRTEHYFDDYPQAHAAALLAGLDSFTDQDAKGEFTAEHVTAAVKRGLISMADVDRAVRRKLLIRLRLGEFDPDGGPFATAGVMDTAAHPELALTAARRTAVLLANDGGLLPLEREARRSVAVVGPLAKSLYEDWYSPALPYAVTIADGLSEAFESAVVHEAAQRVRTDLGEFDVFDWGDDIVTLRSVESGKYLTVTSDGVLAVTADKPDGWVVHETFGLSLVPGGAAFLQSTANQMTFRVRWEALTDGIAAAVAAARDADVAVVVVGNDPMIGGREAHDRATLALPPGMARLVREVTAANPRTVLVIMSSYPYVTPDAPAIVWTSHAGQETGRALASQLTGEHAFEGRLPQAWPASDADLPEALDYDIIKAGWTYQYAAARARFPFGHGLTYTTFSYGNLRVGASAAGSESGETSATSVAALLDVTNTGDRAGTEVVQLYASYPGADQPRRRLIGFTRVALEPGETAAVTIVAPAHRLELWDVAAGRMALPGPVEILAGASSEDIRQTAVLPLPAVASAQRPAQVAAADFDDYVSIALIDTSRSEGTAVTPADPGRPAWVQYANLHPSRLAEPAFRVACASPAGGRIEVWLSQPGDSGASPVASVAVPDTGDQYSWTSVSAPVPVPAPAGTVYLSLHGPVRLDWFQL